MELRRFIIVDAARCGKQVERLKNCIFDWYEIRLHLELVKLLTEVPIAAAKHYCVPRKNAGGTTGKAQCNTATVTGKPLIS